MSTTVKEIQPNSGWFKLRTDFEDRTRYEIRNLSPRGITATFTFFDFENILFEAPRTTQFKGNATYAVHVPAGSTVLAVIPKTLLAVDPPSGDPKVPAGSTVLA